MSYAKGIIEVLEDCDIALQAIQCCVAYDGSKCAPDQLDIELVNNARAAIIEYCQLRDIKLRNQR